VRIRVALHDGDCSTRKLFCKRCDHPNEIGNRRHAPPSGSVSHENFKLLVGSAIDPTVALTQPGQSGFPKDRALDADEHGLLRRRGRRGAETRGRRDDGADPYHFSSSLSFHRSCSPVWGSRG
jgi:hypothetical protein